MKEKQNQVVSSNAVINVNKTSKNSDRNAMEDCMNRVRNGVDMITADNYYINIEMNDNEGLQQLEVADSYGNMLEKEEMIDLYHEYGTRIFLPLSIKRTNMNELSQLPSQEDKGKISNAFVRTALIAKLIGYDGIQINASEEGYLLNQFSHAFCSLSDDNSEENLTRNLQFATDIVKGIKEVCGSDFPVTLRFKINSFVDTLVQKSVWDKISEKPGEKHEAIAAIKILAIAGYDALNIDAGSGNSWSLTNEPALAGYNGYLQELSCNKDNPESQIFGYSMIENMELAAKALDKGVYEAISMEHLIYNNNNFLNNIHSGRYEDMTTFMY